MSPLRWIVIGCLAVVIGVVVLWRLTTEEPAAAHRLARVADDDLLPELALEHPETQRHAFRAPTPVAVSSVSTSTTPTAPAPPMVSIADLTSENEVRRWLENQAAHMAGETGWSRKDPLVDEFARVPSAYWGVMLDAAKHFTSKARGLTEEALIRSAGVEHRELVLKAFSEQLFLVDVVTRYGWVEDCADTMRKRLKDPKFTSNRMGDTTQLLVALASLHDERDFTLFADVLRSTRYGYWQARMARALTTVPGFDLDAAATSAWRYYEQGQYPDHQDGFAVAAARAGIAAALPISVLHAAGGKGTKWSSGELQDEARALLRDHLGLHIDADDGTAALAWWESAKDQVRWDADTRRWTGPKPPVFPLKQEQPAITPGANDF
ncbi:MAG: hypothetical protein H0W78_12550 [Planctomycetes bacterium]|nr:hypothetical protein [Planctomycetota bacterium]